MSETHIAPTKGTGSKLWWHLSALFIMIVWGASFVSTKVLLDNGLNAVEIAVYRFIIAYLLLLAICHKKILANSLKDEFQLALCGILGISVYFLAENTSLKFTMVSNVSLIVSLSPLITVLLMGVFYKNQKPGLEVYLGSILAILGVACIIFQDGLVWKASALGDFLALAAAISFALYSLILARLNVVYDSIYITRKSFFYGALCSLPFLAFEPTSGGLEALMKTEVILNLGFLGIVASMICFMLWTFVIKELGTVTASNYNYLQPVSTIIVAFIILHEEITITGYFGCTLILLGLIISDKLTEKPKLRQA